MRLLLCAAVLLLCFSTQVLAEDAGLYDGIFTGIATGDRGTSALLTLNLTQNGSAVKGIATILPGIKVDTGGLICPGLVDVPAGTVPVKGNVSTRNPRVLIAASAIQTQGMSIVADVLAEISTDGNSMRIQIRLKTPWPCRNPTIRADLTRMRGGSTQTQVSTSNRMR